MSIELERNTLEELHTIEKAITDRIQRNPELYDGFLEDNNRVLNKKKKRSFREVLLQQHEISFFLKQYKKQKTFLEESWNDASRNEVLKTIDDPTYELIKFDELYQSIKSQNDETVVKNLGSIYAMKSSNSNILSEIGSGIDLNLMFSGEEYFGKYLDLVEFHEIWLNLSSLKISYVKYLEIFDKFEEFNDIVNKKQDDYLKYLINLSNYLKNFITKSTPLFKLDSFLNQFEENFNKSKQNQGLYCEACDKNFAKKTVYDAHLSGKKHLKNASKLTTSSPPPSSKNYEYYENLIEHLLTPLRTKRQDTKLNTERRKALTERERLIEISQLEKDEQLSSSEDESTNEQDENPDFKDGVYNPMNLPLGFDGQPIPYWLWKLHGLGIEYTCEICGDYTYKGRKAFDKHFLEPRHIHGLKCLGITPSLVFKDITSIKQAIELWNKVKRQKRIEEGEKEDAVEVEDEEGNVMSEKVYNDLKKQGLI
ncbi:hypothetical protein WICANDRAFT_36002 [Wickerhamomyces anomalus NRRL Y-366-8]|uniref:Matrin-type domain-containing protein n=1 Tax=Wickerhamomyces anomalus (strain ATCC 58044 / CBS 1984 / NCYC 433 / NRRL Y-366-8) TaxID=683960 RepID=A0A1E3NV65_WICAA|nr:uncharacterized protein WICANDRAFT_36002 [Wickerhamomyces anomalus NRRL Y-366-8]ODQ57016.1 hypothetical protein WICANDRAFT_36002 [Wickerhamomyces anomalus NRRL Y-366-8]